MPGKAKRARTPTAGGEPRKQKHKRAPGVEQHTVSLPPPLSVSLPPPRRPLPPHQLVLAPMVAASELPFRLLCRRHGAQLCYTPMMHAAEFINPAHVATPNGVGALQTRPGDAPLVAHFAANDAATLLAAAKRAEPYAVAVDINLGCPQRSAHSGHYGSFLTDPGPDRPLVLGMVSTLARGTRLPVFVKIRLQATLCAYAVACVPCVRHACAMRVPCVCHASPSMVQDTLEETLVFCKQLEAAGCDLIAVHGRVRGHWSHRRKGPADLLQIKAVKEAVRCPVLTNGNVSSPEDLLASLALTGADGVMSAEGALDDPAIFGR